MYHRGATSDSNNHNREQHVKARLPGTLVKQPQVFGPGLERHSGDNQDERFLGNARHYLATTSTGLNRQTNNTYFHRILRRGCQGHGSALQRNPVRTH
eukprot:961387-Prorocentrum_minimum.AAC.1